MENPVLLFDGVCNLCNHTVQFIIKHDKKGVFRFSALQSDFGKKTMAEYGLDVQKLDSVVLIYQNRAFSYSDAPLEIAKIFGGFWQFAYIFKIIPRFIRDAIYHWIAKNRYKWFGKQESCWLPTPELKAKFLN